MSFATLPAELQLLLISQCLQASQPQPASSSSTLEAPVFDAHQAAMLAAVSRSCNATVTKLLYGHVRVTRPSSLRQLHATLSRRPDLAALATSIHLGPDAELVKHGWPIVMAKEQQGDWPELYIKNSLSDGSEASLLPLWCKPGAKVRLSNPQSHDGKGEAIHEAMAAAMRALDVEPWRRRFSWSKAKIGLGPWTARLLLLQAALDLYLIEMRRVEDGQGRAAAQVEYPRFQILRQPLQTTKSGDRQSQGSGKPEEFVVTEEELWQHLQRVGGPGDHFDKLFRLARSTKKTLDMDREEWGRLKVDLGGPYADKLTNREWEDVMAYDGEEEELERLLASSGGAGEVGDPVQEADEVEEADSERFEADDLYSYGGWSSDDEEPASISHQNRFDGVEDLLQLAQSVLAMTSQVNNVSLTSYLFRALPALTRPDLLRSLNIGPKPYWWDQTFPAIVLEKLNKLVRLRVVGHISEEDATTMCHMLPLLEHLQWTETSDLLNNLLWVSRLEGLDLCLAGSRVPSKAPLELSLTPSATCPSSYAYRINALQGKCEPEDGWHAAIALGKRRRESFEDDSHRPTTSPIASSRRRILMLVHPREFSTIANWTTGDYTDPTETGKAWLRGDPVPGTLHPVKVIASEAVDWPAEIRDAGSKAREVAALYAEGRRWWEEGHVQGGATVKEGDEADEAKAGSTDGELDSRTS